MTNEELCQIIGYKYAEYVSTLQKKLRQRGYLTGPLMFPDLGMLFKNQVSRIHAFVMFDTSYDHVRSLLKEIDSWFTFFPLEEGIFRKYLISFMNSNTHKLKKIFDYLTDKGAVKYYHLFEQVHKWRVINPTFLINGSEAPIEPDFDHLLDDISVPDLEYGSFADISLNKVSQFLVERLWNGDGGCDLKKIVRGEKNFREKRKAILKEMLKKEKREERRKEIKENLKEMKKELSLGEFREAYQLLVANNILEKMYYIWPFPQSKCSRYMLFLRFDSMEDTKRAIFNFGTQARIFTRVSIVQSVETKEWYGVIYVTGDPFLGKKLIAALDRCPKIEDKKFFPVRSFPSSHWDGQSISLGEYYHPQTRTLDYPYGIFFERIRQKLETPG